MDNQLSEFYCVEKSKLDKVMDFLSNLYKMCDGMTKVHNEIMELLKESIVYEMDKMNDIITKHIDSSNQ